MQHAIEANDAVKPVGCSCPTDANGYKRCPELYLWLLRDFANTKSEYIRNPVLSNGIVLNFLRYMGVDIVGLHLQMPLIYEDVQAKVLEVIQLPLVGPTQATTSKKVSFQQLGPTHPKQTPAQLTTPEEKTEPRSLRSSSTTKGKPERHRVVGTATTAAGQDLRLLAAGASMCNAE